MKIINIGILAHVDAGKTTLTESLLYTSGAIAEQGNVDKGTTRTDTMILERQRGITIQTAVTSFCWNDYKINIVDTPGHMDFLTEAYRSLSVLDGAVLVISAKDGVQAQTRILFHALQKMNIPTIIFVNKIDQNGIDLRRVYQSIKDKLTSDMIVMQEVALSPKITITDISDLDKWDIIISGNDELLERYVAEDSLDIQELQYEKCKRTRCCSLFPVYHGSAKDNLGTEKLIEAIIETFITETDDIQSELCGYVFKVEYTERKKRLSYLRLYHGTLHLRDTLLLSKKKKIKITEMCIPSNGEIVPADHACPGEIVILADDTLKLNDIVGNEKLLPHKTRIDNPMPLLRTTVEPQKPEQREALLNALAEIADTDPLLHFYIDTVTHEIILSFLGKLQLEVICSLLEEKYHVSVDKKIWEKNAQFWDNAMGDKSNEFHREVVRPKVTELLSPNPADYILDIACGNGNYSSYLAQRGASIVAFDYSKKMIELAKRRQSQYAKQIEFCVADATNRESILELKRNRAFTKAVSNMAIMDITDIEPLLMAVYELLQESGIFVFATQHPCFITLTEKYMTPHSYYGIAIEGQPEEQIYYHRSIQDIFNLCFRAGFVIDGFYEECFKNNKEIPMVMIVRLKKVKRDSISNQKGG